MKVYPNLKILGKNFMRISHIVYSLWLHRSQRDHLTVWLEPVDLVRPSYYFCFQRKREKLNTPTWQEEKRDGTQMCMYEESQH